MAGPTELGPPVTGQRALPLLHLRTETDPVSETCFFKTLDDGQSPKTLFFKLFKVVLSKTMIGEISSSCGGEYEDGSLL
jgi:hypothetical protein